MTVSGSGIATIILAQCPMYSAQFVEGPNCGVFGFKGALGQGVSQLGTACGYYNDCDDQKHAFVWPAGGGLAPISFPFGVTYASAIDVNQQGTAIGDLDPSAPPYYRRAFISIGGQASLLPLLPGHVGSEGHGINSQGIVIGFSAVSNPQAVYWENEVPTALQLSIGPTSVAEDINDQFQICGWMGVNPVPSFGATPFLWANGKTTSLPLPANAVGHSGTANALNNLSDACGYFFTATTPALIRRACAWINGQFVDLGTLPGYQISLAMDINDAREIIGYCESLQGFFAPFIWRNGVMSNLNTLAAPGSPALNIARAINNKGQIAGEGDVNLPVGHAVAFLLTPALPATPGDTNCDGHVNVNDLLAVIDSWNPQGPVGGNPADLNRDNRINVDDLLAVIMHWGN